MRAYDWPAEAAAAERLERRAEAEAEAGDTDAWYPRREGRGSVKSCSSAQGSDDDDPFARLRSDSALTSSDEETAAKITETDAELDAVEEVCRRLQEELEDMSVRAENAEREEAQTQVTNDRLAYQVLLQRRRAETAEAAAMKIEQLQHQAKLQAKRHEELVEHGLLQEERMAARMDEQVMRAEAAEAEAARAKGLLVESVAQLQEAQAERAQLQRRMELKEKEEKLRSRKDESEAMKAELAKQKGAMAADAERQFRELEGQSRMWDPGGSTGAAQGAAAGVGRGSGGRKKKR